MKKRIQLSRPMTYPEVINEINHLFLYHHRWTDYTMYPCETDKQIDKPFRGIQGNIPPQKEEIEYKFIYIRSSLQIDGLKKKEWAAWYMSLVVSQKLNW